MRKSLWVCLVLIALSGAQSVAQTREKPANWNFMDAFEQARWFNEVQRQRLCNDLTNGCQVDPDAEQARQFNERQAQRLAASNAKPANWNFMDAQEQAWWLCRDDPQRLTVRCRMVTKEGVTAAEQAQQERSAAAPNWNFANVEAELARRKRVIDQANREAAEKVSPAGWMPEWGLPNPNYKPAPTRPANWMPEWNLAPTRCGRACGQPWTDEDFAASARELERLEREIAQLRSLGNSLSISEPAPIYTPRYRAPRYTYTPPLTYPRQSTTSRIGGTTFYSGDVSGSATSIPPFTYYNFSNGVSGSAQDIGPFTYYNFNTRRGQTTNGTTQRIGTFQYHNLDNGVSGTSQTIGDFKYTNFSNGKNCTSQTIGTFVYTNCY